MQLGRTGFRVLAYLSAAVAVVGVVLPLLPTTPFVLLAAYFASKGHRLLPNGLKGILASAQPSNSGGTGARYPPERKYWLAV